ncbi:hypothetical protein BN440_3649 [Erwinia amylovora MR1]|nr:hypothetical protein BN440_3649 [Erwinia amylovora MR1]
MVHRQTMACQRELVLKVRHKTLDNRLPAINRHLANLSSADEYSSQSRLSVCQRHQ